MQRFIIILITLIFLTACAQVPAVPQLPAETQLPMMSPTQTETLQPAPTETTIPPHMPEQPTPFFGEVFIENAQVSYYEITGTTEKELRMSMNEVRPKDPYDNNKPVDAYTEWYISWTWSGYGQNECDLSTAKVSYTVKIIMPRWQNPAGASPQLTAKWEQYIQNLALHEKEHVDNIAANYLSVQAAIQGATCATADAAAQQALVELRKFDAEYDRQTKHGATQGCIFP